MKERPILFSAPMVRAIIEGRKTMTRRIVKPMPGSQSKWLTMSGIDNVPHGAMSGGGWQMHHPLADQCVDGVQIEHDSPLGWIRCPYGSPGDRLWVRETHFVGQPAPDDYPQIVYRADMAEHATDGRSVCPIKNHCPSAHKGPWKPAIHMPRWASRLLLDVVSVSVERLQDISEADAKAEGVESPDTEREEHDWSICEKCGGTLLYNGLGANLGVIFDCDCLECDTHKKRFRNLWDYINGKRADWASNPWVWVVEFQKARG
jgi:hypothetical protein